MTGASPRWYLLVHQIPPKPLYLRAKVRNRLARVGAVALKNSVYLLPRSADALEDFQWIAQEVVAGGGEAHLLEAAFLGRPSDRDVERLFNESRDRDYAEFAEQLGNSTAPDLARMRRRFDEIRQIDFFGARGRERAERLLRRAEERQRPRKEVSMASARSSLDSLRHQTWVTRRGVKVDRIGTAWLIRRFVDPKALFRFIDPKAEEPGTGERSFDMVGGEFTHEGDRCTFETLLRRLGMKDRALAAVAEIVHDVDVKDSKFGRPESPGLSRLVAGVVAAHGDDEDRLTQGFLLFDALYESFRKGGKP
jgi:hypothetical protein